MHLLVFLLLICILTETFQLIIICVIKYFIIYCMCVFVVYEYNVNNNIFLTFTKKWIYFQCVCLFTQCQQVFSPKICFLLILFLCSFLFFLIFYWQNSTNSVVMTNNRRLMMILFLYSTVRFNFVNRFLSKAKLKPRLKKHKNIIDEKRKEKKRKERKQAKIEWYCVT